MEYVSNNTTITGCGCGSGLKCMHNKSLLSVDRPMLACIKRNTYPFVVREETFVELLTLVYNLSIMYALRNYSNIHLNAFTFPC